MCVCVCVCLSQGVIQWSAVARLIGRRSRNHYSHVFSSIGLADVKKDMDIRLVKLTLRYVESQQGQIDDIIRQLDES